MNHDNSRRNFLKATGMMIGGALIPGTGALAFGARIAHADEGDLLGFTKTRESFDFAKYQLGRTIAVTPSTAFPVFTDNRTTAETYGQWVTRTLPKPKFPDWRVGFFPGNLWLVYEYTRDTYWRDQAERWTQELDYLKDQNHDHDVGFQLLTSAGNALRLTRNDRYRPILLGGAASLATRFNPAIGSTQSWGFGIPQNWTFPVIVDNMLNLEILFWSATHGGDRKHFEMAWSHALRTREDHIRPDGGTYHVVDYDPVTGNVIKKLTWQGYANETTWARGQAWAIYGFTMAYRYTRDLRLLETAIRVADYYIDHVRQGDWVPNWDFQAPAQYTQKDSSAAAIAASAFTELAILAGGRPGKQELFTKYRRAAGQSLNGLYRGYLAQGTRNAGLLVHGTDNYPASWRNGDFKEIDIALIYGDYYFLEALLRYTRCFRGAADIGSGSS